MQTALVHRSLFVFQTCCVPQSMGTAHISEQALSVSPLRRPKLLNTSRSVTMTAVPWTVCEILFSAAHVKMMFPSLHLPNNISKANKLTKSSKTTFRASS